MEYTKPQIVSVSNALDVINQLDESKGHSTINDHTMLVFASDPAYEADE